jgi:hypothetical protein
VIEPLSEEDVAGFLATVPELPGCMSDGETRAEALANVEGCDRHLDLLCAEDGPGDSGVAAAARSLSMTPRITTRSSGCSRKGRAPVIQMRILNAVAATLLLAACATGPAPAPRAAASPAPLPDFARMETFVSFERDPSTPLEIMRVRVGTAGGPFWADSEPVVYWFVLQRESLGGQVIERAYTSTGLCPAALPVLQRLERVAMPHPDVPRFGEDWSLIGVDGIGYRLSMRAVDRGGKSVDYDVQASSGTSIGDWVEKMVEALADCWTPAAANVGLGFPERGD